MSDDWVSEHGQCSHCGIFYIASAADEPGFRERDDYNCPNCGQHAGSMMCSGIINVGFDTAKNQNQT